MAVSSLHAPRGRSNGPPPTRSPTGAKLPGRRNCVAAASASPTASPCSAPWKRSRSPRTGASSASLNSASQIPAPGRHGRRRGRGRAAAANGGCNRPGRGSAESPARSPPARTAAVHSSFSTRSALVPRRGPVRRGSIRRRCRCGRCRRGNAGTRRGRRPGPRAMSSWIWRICAARAEPGGRVSGAAGNRPWRGSSAS